MTVRSKRRKPSAEKIRKPASPADLQQRLYSAAFASRDLDTFGQACVAIIAETLDAAEVVVAMTASDATLPSYFATNNAALELVSSPSSRNTFAKCLSAGTERKITTTAPAGAYKSHDAKAMALGWHHYIYLSLKNGSGITIGAVAAYFTETTNLRQKSKLFESLLRTTLTAAIAARCATPANAVDTHQFNSLAATIPGVVYQRIVYPDGDIRYIYLSEGAREMFGVDPDAVVKDPNVLFSTFTEDYAKTFRPRLMEASKSLTKWDVEASMILPDGRRRTTHAIASPERRADGSVLWTGVILDASRAKEAEENLKAANREVGLANQAKSAFLAKMSHEMRTPLNGVLGMGDLLLKTELSPRQTRLATTLCDSAKGLLGIINDVLDLSRIEAGQFKLDMQDFNLRHCIEDAVELCATAGYRKGLEINLIIAPNMPIGVNSDSVRIRQILINLIGNAIKFTEAGEVVVRLSPTADADGKAAVAFEVSDTGIGIDQAAINRLFEPFAQADSSISRRFGGTGLGLSITRHLVEMLGGTITLTSERGKGTNVRFVIPFEVTASAKTASILSQVCLTGVRTLIIDDRATNREAMRTNLGGSGTRVDCAASEAEAIEILKQAAIGGDPYKIAIVDRVRPRCSGLHLCRTIRSDVRLSATSLVVLMSANWNANPVDQQGLNNTVFLSKPMRRTDLIAAMARTQSSDGILSAQAIPASAAIASKTLIPALKLRVLLVEDNQTNIEVAREYLNELDCRVTVAVNGIEAIAAYDRSSFDVIMMDTQMPELDGLSATRRIRECERLNAMTRVPIIAVTANAYDSDRTQALEAGSDDFLSKPFTDIQLRNVLMKWSRHAATAATEARALVSTPGAIEVAHQKAATAVGPAGASEPLDVALHTVLLKSRPAFLGRLVRAFLSSVPETIAALQAAVSHSDTELLRQAAHSLKSGSANVGAKRLSEMCRVLEMKLRLGADAADCETLAASVANELHLAEKALEQLLARLPVADARQSAAS